ncbi:polysaccharide biosynthesis protein [Edaphobacter acidisoli]|uniref:Polysaccharide biosynthesis protein n=1 Tax=Edaphobacter acidisoli TaxID=2040573 RepID=A0A916RYG4_9BACT|nr:polysaccharide biosynthesis C-terminal domain-containing protein [Edaphobacter acidisoli]GGA76547.1 polysaccharide biosynthesis protein [Edaphobacter acidisoli]
MVGTKRFAINVLMNWAAMAVGMVVPFFLTPFVLHRLGDVEYGIWILAVSTVSYLAILDMGMRSAVIRFVSKAEAQQKLEDATAAVGAALWVRVLISLGVAVLSVLLALAFPHLFKIPADLRHAGQVTVLMCALGVAVTLVSGVFGAVLAATHRFDLLSAISGVQTLFRAGGVVLILETGHGLIALAYWEVTVVSLGALATVVVAWKLFPPCRVKFAKPDMGILKMIWSYSFTTFIFIIAVQIIINSDNLVVGAFLSVGMVAFYSIGGSLMNYSGQVVSAVSTTFTPMASNLEAVGKLEELQRLLLRGTQAMLGIGLPISLALVLRGKTFIGLWMGPKYQEISGTVLQILIISQFFSIADGTAGSVMMAIDKHKPVAKWAVIEAVLNFGLSIVLVKTIGIYGVAWGTTIAMAFVHLTFYPRYVRKVLDIPIRKFLWEGWTKITLCSVPYAIACAITDRYWHASNLAEFFVQIIAVLPVYVLCVIAAFRSEARALFLKWQASRLVQA